MSAPELSPSARALLDAAREGMTPDAAAIARVRGKVTAVAGGAAASALVLKLGLAGVLAAVTIGAIVSQHSGRSDAPAMAPQIALPAESSPTRVYEVVPVEVPAEVPVEAAPIEMAAEPMRRTESSDVKLTVDIEPADLAREVELIDRAMKALATNDPNRALATIKLHVAETRGKGQLAEDAAAIEIEALCRLHSPTVTAKLDAFDARFPRSAQRSRLSTHCQEP
jgi:hypothetical protein